MSILLGELWLVNLDPTVGDEIRKTRPAIVVSRDAFGVLALWFLYRLPISLKHTAVVATLPFHHRDPFDRLLVARAISEGIPIVSIDCALDAYSVARIW